MTHVQVGFPVMDIAEKERRKGTRCVDPEQIPDRSGGELVQPIWMIVKIDLGPSGVIQVVGRRSTLYVLLMNILR